MAKRTRPSPQRPARPAAGTPSSAARRAARLLARDAGSAQAPPDQFTVCTRHCEARCCRYITVMVPPPRSEPDWDEVRWWLAHEGVIVTHDADGWMLSVMVRCQNLGADNACGIYPDHMLACKEYDPTDCEFTGEVPFDVKLECEEDLADYLERKRLVRGRGVAASIRSAARRRAQSQVKRPAAPSGLVTLAPLTPFSRPRTSASGKEQP